MLYRYENNALVKKETLESSFNKTKFDHCEYFSISFKEKEEGENGVAAVSITRYGVPGRYDIYSFDYHMGCGPSRVRYFSDEHHSILEALKMVEADLNNENVAKMIVDSVKETKSNFQFGRQFCYGLLDSIAPNSLSYKELDAYLKEEQKQINARIAAKKAARLLAEQNLAVEKV